MSETKDPTRVQPHLRKCFEGIHRLRFKGVVVEAMTSVEGELVPLKTHVNTASAKGAVERWLLEVGRKGDGGREMVVAGGRSFEQRPSCC